MVNLIPPSAKRSVTIEYWLRVFTVWAVTGTVVVALFAVTMLPVYVLVDIKINVFEESANVASQKIASFETVSQDLRRATQQAQLIIANEKETSLSSAIYLFDTLEQGGIELNNIKVVRSEEGIAPVTLLGTARDRQALADFRDRLIADALVESVDFPISNLAKDRDIAFVFTVTMTNESS